MAMAAAQELHARLREMAHEMGARFVEPDAAWYGLDRIHVRRGAQGTAWRDFFVPLASDSPVAIRRATHRDFFYIRSLTPYQRWLCGVSHGRQQPSGRLADGTLVSLY